MVNCSYEREVGFYKMISGFRASQNLPFPLKTPAVHFAEFHKPSGVFSEPLNYGLFHLLNFLYFLSIVFSLLFSPGAR